MRDEQRAEQIGGLPTDAVELQEHDLAERECRVDIEARMTLTEYGAHWRRRYRQPDALLDRASGFLPVSFGIARVIGGPEGLGGRVGNAPERRSAELLVIVDAREI